MANAASFTVNDPNAAPFVEIRGGKKDGTQIGIINGGPTSLREKVDLTLFLEELRQSMKPREIAVVERDVLRGLREGTVPIEGIAAAVYNEVLATPSEPARSFECADGKFVPVFGRNRENNRVAFVFGASGAGKSTAMKVLANSWREAHKKGTIYVFSRFKPEDDSSLNFKGNVEYITEERMLEQIAEKGEGFKCDDLENEGGCLIIGDDYDTLKPKAYLAISDLIRDALVCGRKHNVSLILTAHLGADRTRPIQRLVWTEAHLIGIFPASCSGRDAEYVFRDYCGLTVKQINRMTSINSRCVWFRKHVPKAVCGEHEIYLLSKEDVK